MEKHMEKNRYPNVPPLSDPLGFLQAELKDLEESKAEAEHPSPGHREVRSERCDRLLAFARDVEAPVEIVAALQAYQSAIEPFTVEKRWTERERQAGSK